MLRVFKDMAQFVTGNDTLLLVGKMRIDCYVSDTIYNRSEATQTSASSDLAGQNFVFGIASINSKGSRVPYF